MSKYYLHTLKAPVFLLMIVLSVAGYSQQPCTNPPNGEGCLCSTAGILCTPDILDGFTFTMASTSNLGGLSSSDLCPGIEDQDGGAHNVNWFAFIAWCENLTMDVNLSNCQPGIGGGGAESYGVQIALFGNCSTGSFGWDPIACITEPDESCFDEEEDVPDVQTFVANDLVIGDVYYFMLDGCAGSTCDVTIDVIGVCGTGEIDDWSEPIDGPTFTCVGATDNYSVEDLDGAVEFYYYLDGVLIDDGTELQSIDITWDMPGTYQLCVDVSNLPCIPESDDPVQNCTTIEVVDVQEAVIVANPSILCPTETSTITASNFGTHANLYQNIIIVGPDNNTVYQVENDFQALLTYEYCGEFTAYFYNFLSFDGNPPILPNVGDTWSPPDCSDDCCDIVSVDILFQDDELPSFINPPPTSLALDCIDDLMPADDLMFTDNCIGSGIADLEESDDVVDCDGGEVIRKWSAIDSCNNLAQFTQVITVAPIPEAVFITPPDDITVACSAVPSTFDDLNYSNSLGNSCDISGAVSPSIVDNSTPCGGSMQLTWEFTDDCDRTITHQQNIEISPPLAPDFVNIPVDVTINCGDPIPDADDLQVTNGDAGSCLIDELVSPTIEDNTDDCSGNLIYTWEYTDPCGGTITAMQTITINPPDEAVFTNEPANQTINCDEVATLVIDPLDYTNSLSGNCLIEGTVMPQTTDNSSSCGGDITTIWEFTDVCGRVVNYTQVITVNPAASPQFIDPPADITIECGESISASDLAYTNNESGICEIMGSVTPVQDGDFDICGSTVTFTWSIADPCGINISYSQNVLINPAPEAVFLYTPDDITVSCQDFNSTPPSLDYSNNETGDCLISGSVNGTLVGSAQPCGGDVQYMWTFTDECARTIEYSQTVTVEPAPEPEFLNPPADITVSCSDVPPIGTLNFSNGATGACGIGGQIAGFQTGSYDECGGQIVYNWSFTDQCGTTITHSQMITVEPASEPEWVNPPESTSIGCGEEFPDPLLLEYSNGESGPCSIQGFEDPVIIEGDNIVEYVWTFVNPCSNNEITHTQIITGVSTPELSIVPSSDVICLGDAFDLSAVQVTDLNGQNLTLQYFLGSELNSPIVSPTTTTIYTILGTNEDGCQDDIQFELVVENPPFAGLDGDGVVCSSTPVYDLFDYLGPNYDQGGNWTDLDFSGANIDNPQIATFNGVLPGTYQFQYEVNSGSVCPSDIAIVTLTVIDDLDFEVFSVICSDNASTYTVTIYNPNQYNFTSSEGSVETVENDSIKVIDIPIDENLIVTAIDPVTFCITDLFINPPNCDCPDVAPPVSNGNPKICLGESIPTLSVNVGADLTANWYSQQSGGAPLAEGTIEYNPTITGAGIYTFYVEAEDDNGCTSITKIPVVLEVIALPIANNILIQECANENDEIVLNLSTYNQEINQNGSFTIGYYYNLNDAENSENGINTTQVTFSENDTIISKVTAASGCVNYGEVIIDILPYLTYTLEISNEVCLNDSNGIITINNISESGSLFSLDGINYNDEVSFDSLASGMYTLYSLSTDNCERSESVTINEGLEILYSDLSIICNDNSTSLDPLDDFYTISFTVSNNQQNIGQVNVLVDGQSIGQFTFGSVEFEFPADGNTHTVEIIDTDTSCSINFEIGPLNPCSSDCQITLETFEWVCNDNGTNTDNSDDFYEVTFLASSINGATTNAYTLTVNGNLLGIYQYNESYTIEVDADGTSPNLLFVDAEDEQCFLNETFGPLISCSNTCVITAEVSLECSNNNTSDDENDDFYTLDFSVDGVNVSNMFSIILDGTAINDLMYPAMESITIPADGQIHLVQFVDSENEDCFYEYTTDMLIPCSICEGTVDAGQDQILDCDITEVTLTGTNSGDGDLYWIDPNGEITNGNTIVASIAGEYVFSMDFGQNCIISDTLIVGVSDDIPNVITVGNQSITCLVDTANLSATVQGGSGNFSYEWTDENGVVIGNDLNITVNTPGNYYLTVLDLDTECKSPKSLVRVLNNTDGPAAVIYADPGDILDCVIEVIYISNEEEEDVVYAWFINNEPVDGQDIVIDEPSLIELLAVDTISGCDNMNALDIVSLEDYPIINLASADTLNCGVPEISIDGTSSQSGNSIEYAWYDLNGDLISEGESILSVTEPGDYILELEDVNNGCINSDTITVVGNLDGPILIDSESYSLSCSDSVIIIGVEIIDADEVSFQWTTTSGEIISSNDLQNITVNSEGVYTVIVEDLDNNCSTTQDILVESASELDPALIELEPESCENNTDGMIIIDPPANGTPPFTYEVGDSIYETNVISGLTMGTYEIKIEDALGCVTDTIVSIEVLDDFEINLQPQITVSKGSNITLSVTVDVSEEEISSIQWLPSTGLSCDTCLTTVLSGSEAADNYQITVTTIDGCMARASILVNIEDVISIPNIFSPNNDNKNDFFTVYSTGEGGTIEKFQVFDRWGEMLFNKENFSLNDPQMGWDGTFKGKDVVQGVYVYIIYIRDDLGNVKTYSGDITLIR